MKTYTDDEIVRALECCLQSRSMDDCKKLNCPAYVNNDCYFMSNVKAYSYEDALFKGLCTQLLDLIKRQQAEIASLKTDLEDIATEYDAYKEAVEVALVETRAEAIKEFAERLKEKAASTFYEERKYVDTEDIDELVKEMTEGGDAT